MLQNDLGNGVQSCCKDAVRIRDLVMSDLEHILYMYGCVASSLLSPPSSSTSLKWNISKIYYEVKNPDA